jgi:hypothetical protein
MAQELSEDGKVLVKVCSILVQKTLKSQAAYRDEHELESLEDVLPGVRRKSKTVEPWD